MSDDTLRTSQVIKWLPDIFGRNESAPEGLVSATIVQVGTFKDAGLVETGGLVIDYHPADSLEVRRVVLAFNDTAMWVEAVFRQTQI